MVMQTRRSPLQVSPFVKFLAFLVVFIACVSPCVAQNAEDTAVEDEAIDFSIANEGSVTSTEEVVSGVLLIYGEIDTDFLSSGDIDIVIKETLGKVCKNFDKPTGAPTLTKMFVDVRTVGQRRIGMNYSWQILPPLEAGKDCINRLAMVGFGPKEPPFDKYPAPPLRQLLTQELKAHPPTRLLNTTAWTISMQNMSCDERKVIKHWNHSRSIDVFPTEEPECLGSDSITWQPNLEGEFDVAEVGSCNTAGSNACVCAALPSCEWVPGVNGIATCVHTALPGVPCEACALQDRCVITPAKLCASKSAPCACVLAQGGCNWNMEKGICELNPTGGTACIACPRQYFCSTPQIRAKSPQNLAIMGSEEVGWLINMSFDREMEFMHIGIGSGVLLQCRPVRPGDWPPTFEVEYRNLEIDRTMLHINVFGLPNDENRDCDVVITDTAVRGVDALLPFNGLPDNEMFVTLPDGIPPQVNSFMPGNSAVSVPIDPIVRFFFDETIKFWRESNIGVYTLGGNQSDREADKLIAELSIWSAAVTIDQDTLIVDLTGILSTSTYYSVTIPIGAVSDLSNNPFPGIARGVYMFQTGADERVEVLRDTTEDDTLMHTIIIIVAGCLVGIVALAAAYMACDKVHKVRRRARVVARKETMEMSIEKVDIEKPQLPKLNHDLDDDDGWPMEHMLTSPASPGSPSSQTPTAGSIRRASSEKIKVPRSPTSRPNVQVFSKPEELKTQVHTQLRNAGTVVSLADYHNKSSQMMRTIGGKADDRKRRPGGASTAPSSPVAGRRHSAMPQGVPRLVEGNPGARRLQSAEGSTPFRCPSFVMATAVAAPYWWQDSESVVKEIIHSLQTRCTSGNWSYDNVKYNISAGIAQVKLDEPRTGNALRHKTVSALLDICVELHGRPDVKAVVFTASGFYFSTGGAFGPGETPEDESDFAPRLEPGASRFETAVAENLPIAHLLYLMSTLPQYKVAAIRGSIMGAGISLVAAMDYVVAPESRTQLSFKEATRGLGACCSWQATVAKLGVMKMRQLCLLAEDVNANQAKELKLVDHIVTGAAKDAFIEADALALAKAKEVARKCLDERQALKTTGPLQRKPLLQLAGLKNSIEALLEEVSKRHGLEPRCPVHRFSNQMWPYEAYLASMLIW